MASVPPPIGPNGHPRYSQHAEHERPGVGAPMGYGGGPGGPPPHGSFGNSFSTYPHPYANSMDGSYGGGPPPPGYPRGAYSMPPHSFPYGPAAAAAAYGPGGPGGGMPGGYSQSPPHPASAYPYGAAAGYESHYGGGQGPPGHMPHSHSHLHSHSHGPPGSYRGASPAPSLSNPGPPANSSAFRVQGGHPPPGALPASEHGSLVSGGSSVITKKGGSSPPGSAKAVADVNGKRGSPQQQQQQEKSLEARQPDHSEVERLRAVAATEITHDEVKPIQTDFHFFVREHVDKYRKIAEEEVRKSLAEDDTQSSHNPEQPLDPVLVNSNLNTRLMKVWEDLPNEKRDAYMMHEEADRRRFMEEDEIASRHCATLTARGKSPRVLGHDAIKEIAALQRQRQQQEKVKKEPQQEEQGGGGGAPKPDAAPNGGGNEEKKTEEPVSEEAKRSSPDSGAQIQESPSKKNKVG
eukprot:jgi/Psemu1/30779/gm1.30779_g